VAVVVSELRPAPQSYHAADNVQTMPRGGVQVEGIRKPAQKAIHALPGTGLQFDFRAGVRLIMVLLYNQADELIREHHTTVTVMSPGASKNRPSKPGVSAPSVQGPPASVAISRSVTSTLSVAAYAGQYNALACAFSATSQVRAASASTMACTSGTPPSVAATFMRTCRST